MKKKRNFKRTLAIIGSLAVVVPAALVAACTPTKVIVNKIGLITVIKNREIDGNKFNTESAVLNQVVALNNSVTLNDIEIKSGSFNAASEGKDGSAIIIAKSGSKYTDEVEIKITAKDKIALSNVIKNREIDGNKFNTESAVLNQVVALNNSVTLNDIEIKSGSFNAASEGKDGSAIIIAKSGSKYTDEVEIKITAKDKIALSNVIKNREIDGNKFNTESAVLNQVVALNNSVTLNDIEIKSGSFNAASEGKDGSAIIIAKSGSKYTDEVEIKITAKDKIALSNVIKNREIDGNKFNTESAVLNQVVALNNSVTLNDIEIKSGSFNAASEGKDGSAIIIAKSGSKYTDEVEIKITALPANNEQKIVNAINSAKYTNSVILNSEISNLKTAINAEFIKNKLTDEIVKIFEDNFFSLNTITNDKGIELTNKDLTTTGLIIGKINYNYGAIKNQNTELKIIIPGLPITDERENALKDIIIARDALINNEDDSTNLMYNYIGKTQNYFNLIIDIINQNMFYFNANDLTNENNEILKAQIINQLDLIVQSDLNRWNLDKLYNLNKSRFNSTLEIDKTNQTIKISDSIMSLMWISPKTGKDVGTFYPLQFPEVKIFYTVI